MLLVCSSRLEGVAACVDVAVTLELPAPHGQQDLSNLIMSVRQCSADSGLEAHSDIVYTDMQACE